MEVTLVKTFANSLESCKHALEEFYIAVHLRVVNLAKGDLQYPGAGLTIEDCTNSGNPLCDADDLSRVTELVNRCPSSSCAELPVHRSSRNSPLCCQRVYACNILPRLALGKILPEAGELQVVGYSFDTSSIGCSRHPQATI